LASIRRAAVLAALAVMFGRPALADDDAVQSRIDQLRRWAAAGAKHEDSIRSAFRDESPWVRMEAALALWKIRIGAQEAIDALHREVRGSDIALVAAERLASLGAAGVETLVTELTSGEARAAAMYGLSAVETLDPAKLAKVREVCVKVLKKPRNEREVAYCIGLVRGKPALARACTPLAFRYLKSGDLAYSVLRLMEKSAPEEAQFAPLRKFIGDETVRFTDGEGGANEHRLAASLLCRFGRRGVEAILERYAQPGEHPYTDCWMSALIDNADVAFEPMFEALRSPQVRKRDLAVWFIVKSEQNKPQARRLVPELTRLMLEDEDAGLRETITRHLPRMVQSVGKAERIADLEKAVGDHPDENVRVAVIQCLIAGGHVPVELLLAQLRDKSERVRIMAVDALGEAGTRAARAVDPVLAALERGAPVATCIYTLARIAPGDPRVIAAVTKRLDVESRTDAIWSARAVARMGPHAKSAEPLLRELTGKGWDVELWRWRQLALWRVTGEQADLARLLRGVKVALRDYHELHPRFRNRLFEVLQELEDDARPLATVLVELARNDAATKRERRRLAEIARRLTSSTGSERDR